MIARLSTLLVVDGEGGGKERESDCKLSFPTLEPRRFGMKMIKKGQSLKENVYILCIEYEYIKQVHDDFQLTRHGLG